MNQRIACLLAAIVLLFSYCKKDAEPEKVSLNVDKTDLSLFGLLGSVPTSFVIQTQGGWQITSSEDWLTTSQSAGTGDTRITVQASMTNTTTKFRTATLTVKSTSDISIQPITVTVVQQAVEITISAAKFLGGPGGSLYDNLYNAVRTKDGGFIMAGMVLSRSPDMTPHDVDDMWVIKTDADGNLSWQRAIGGGYLDRAYKVIEMEDGGYTVVGTVESYDGDIPAIHGHEDAAIVRLDVAGNIKWKKVWGGSLRDDALALAETTDGGLIIAGNSSSNDGDMEGQLKGSSDTWLLSLDKDGNSRWQKVIGGNGTDVPRSIIKTADNSYLLVGITNTNTGEFTDGVVSYGFHSFIREIDANGNKLMHVNYGGAEYSQLSTGVQTADGGFILTGTTTSTDGDFISNRGSNDVWLLKIDRTGKKIWQKPLGGTSGDVASSVRVVDNGYIVIAYSYSKNRDLNANLGNSDIWVFQVDDKGGMQWQKSFGGTWADDATDIFYNADKTITVLINTVSNDENCKGNPGGSSPAMFKLTVR